MNDKSKVLHLTLKKKWFDMIACGEKKEEYREIKPYWINRLCEEFNDNSLSLSTEKFQFTFLSKKYDIVKFRNGYGKLNPSITLPFEMLVIRNGRTEWGAEPGKKYFVIKLGDKI